MGSQSRASHRDPLGWSVEVDPRGAAVYPTELPTLPSALPTRGGRKLRVATRRVWLGGDCADWSVALPGTSECSGDASGASGTWHSYCPAQCDLFDAAL